MVDCHIITLQEDAMGKVPKFLVKHYDYLDRLVKENCPREAERYLDSLDPGVYDHIISRSYRGGCFETLINKIEELRINKKTNELFKLNSQQNDDNFLF